MEHTETYIEVNCPRCGYKYELKSYRKKRRTQPMKSTERVKLEHPEYRTMKKKYVRMLIKKEKELKRLKRKALESSNK
ncbi:MAG: hypothetical protein Q4F79_03200 [Eubacteriales bacterium]|nr:hypothetical protein [Eubacteriales bacterium]